jgi:hypothetical protein
LILNLYSYNCYVATVGCHGTAVGFQHNLVGRLSGLNGFGEDTLSVL